MYKSIKKIFYFGMFYLGPFFQMLTNQSFKKEDVQKILVIAIGEIGDILRLFPFLNSLRKGFPYATLTLLTTLPANHDIWRLLPGSIRIDKIILFDIQGIHEHIIAKLKLIQKLRKKGFNLTIDTSRGHGMVANSLMSFLIGSPHRIGFQSGGIGFLHTVKVTFKEDVYIGRQNLKLLESIGITPVLSEIKIEPSVPNKEIKNLFKKLKYPIITIHPGAKWHGSQRCWPSQHYFEVAQIISKELKATIIFLGDSTEKPLISRITKNLMDSNVLNMAGKTSLSEAAFIVKHSHLFVGNDSLLLHLAVTLNTPAIGIFGPTSPKQVLPNSPYLITVTLDMPCRPCYTHQPLYTHKCPHQQCLTKLPVEKVMTAVISMINMHALKTMSYCRET